MLSGVKLQLEDYEWSEAGVRLHFIAVEGLGGGMPTDWYVFLTNAEVEASNINQLGAMVQSRVNRNWGEATLNDKLDAQIGNTITVA